MPINPIKRKLPFKMLKSESTTDHFCFMMYRPKMISNKAINDAKIMPINNNPLELVMPIHGTIK